MCHLWEPKYFTPDEMGVSSLKMLNVLHRAQGVTAWLDLYENGASYSQGPSKSPNTNPVEHPWEILNSSLSKTIIKPQDEEIIALIPPVRLHRLLELAEN